MDRVRRTSTCCCSPTSCALVPLRVLCSQFGRFGLRSQIYLLFTAIRDSTRQRHSLWVPVCLSWTFSNINQDFHTGNQSFFFKLGAKGKVSLLHTDTWRLSGELWLEQRIKFLWSLKSDPSWTNTKSWCFLNSYMMTLYTVHTVRTPTVSWVLGAGNIHSQSDETPSIAVLLLTECKLKCLSYSCAADHNNCAGMQGGNLLICSLIRKKDVTQSQTFVV